MCHNRTPDIDTDFSNQEHIFKHLQDLHGVDNVGRIATYGTLACRNLVRKILGVFDYSQQEIAIISGSIPKRLDVTVAESYKESDVFRKFMDENEFIWKACQRLEGTICHEGKHAGGVIVYDGLTSMTPCKYENDSNGNRCIPVVQFDKKQIESTGFYKLDILALENLTTVKYALDMIKDDEGTIIDLDNINFEDKDVYKMLSNGDVSGIFQLSSQGKITGELKPSSFSELIALNSIIRPGCTQLNEYIERSNGKKWSDYDERLPYTSDTYGLIVYQEQFILDCKTYANWDLGFADNNTRKNKDIVNDIDLKNKFIKDGLENGYNEDKLIEIWQGIVDACTNYNFNKSHATSYAVLSYKTAWLKHYYPIYWYASLMNSEKDKEHGQQRVEGLIAECKKKGIQILPPDINKGNYKFEGTRDGIRIPINLLKGVGEDVVKYIQKELIPITSFEDMLDRGLTKYIKKNVVSAMVKSGVFDFENTNREHFIWVYNMRKRKKTDIKNGVECEHLEYDEKIKLKWEREVLGMYLSRHPLDIYNARSIEDYTNDMVAIQVIEITDVREHMQKNGKMMCFVQGSNQHGSLKCLIFADSWASQDIKDKAFVGNVVMLKGKRSGSDMIIQDIENMEV